MRLANKMIAIALAAMVGAAEPPPDTRDEKALAELRRIRRERKAWQEKHAAELKAAEDAAAAPYREANRARRAKHIRQTNADVRQAVRA
jgi:hypothetical protein